MSNPTTASIRAAVEHAVRAGMLEPHQLAALSARDARLTPEQRHASTSPCGSSLEATYR
jgi:hypothetical protein